MTEPLMSGAILRDAVLRIGEVSGIEGRKVYISVDKNKNSSDLLLDGDIVKNISVGAYVEIRKGFLSIIGKTEGETLREDVRRHTHENEEYHEVARNRRTLTVSLAGYVDREGRFKGGIRELPLIGNEAYILTEEKIHEIHNLLGRDSFLSIGIAKTSIEEIPVRLPVDGLFNSHIAIFGNTGSGKSNTLASLFQALVEALSKRSQFKTKCKFLLFDFNGEYENTYCITADKTVYSLTTREETSNRIPISREELLNVETLSILVDATDKTQKPFLGRALRLYESAKSKGQSYSAYLQGTLRNKVRDILRVVDREVAINLLDCMVEILRPFVSDEERRDLRNQIRFKNYSFFFLEAGKEVYFDKDHDAIERTKLFLAIDRVTAKQLDSLPELEQFALFLHLKLVEDLYQYRVSNKHIYPVINRFRNRQESITRTFDVDGIEDFWGDSNFAVVSLRNVNLGMRKTIPLLLAKTVYNEHKKKGNTETLNIIVDEAHNILSKTSFRETVEWKDYRLETFEEIIKEGRKFGVFMTIASQRPNDISETIISQAHNYFIHQLVNQNDLKAIRNAVSYIDRVTEESIPTLALGTCIFSGIATPMPLKLLIDELSLDQKPESHTLRFEKVTAEDPDEPTQESAVKP